MKYLILTLKHKYFVFLACRRMKVSLWQALIHDWTKFLPAELPHYDRHFFGDRGDPAGFEAAWLHHQNHNPHHWEYWISRAEHFKSETGDGCIEMPEKYVREMIADWMGAGRAYTGSWDITEWLNKNLSRIRVHPNTRRLLNDLLLER